MWRRGAGEIHVDAKKEPDVYVVDMGQVIGCQPCHSQLAGHSGGRGGGKRGDPHTAIG